MSETPVFLIAKILGISTTVFLSGFAFCASYYSLPALALAPVPLRLQQWQVIYDLGKLVSPPVSAVSALLWGLTAWNSKNNQDSSDWKFYAAASFATLAIPLWTLVVMMPTNNELIKRSKAAKEGFEPLDSEQESVKLLGAWDRMNFVRAVLPMVGAWVGLYALLR